MSWRRAITLMALPCLLLMSWSVAHADVCKLAPFKGAKNVIVTLPGKSSEFDSLLRNGMHAEAARCCLACFPDVGTSVIITDRGFMSHTIRVLEGPSRGCVGDVPMEFVKDCR